MEDEFIKKLKEKYEKGEISKETYEDILKRYLEEKNEKMEEEQEKMENEERDVADFVENIIENAMKSVEMALKEVNMEMKKEFSTKEGKNYKCAGSCVLGPGRYDYISASGSLMITGDIIAERISVSGALKSEGSVKVKTSLRCAGATKINGDVIAESISAAGVFRAKKVFGETVKLSGAIDVEKIKGESVQIGGYVSADHISGEEIRIKLIQKYHRGSGSENHGHSYPLSLSSAELNSGSVSHIPQVQMPEISLCNFLYFFLGTSANHKISLDSIPGCPVAVHTDVLGTQCYVLSHLPHILLCGVSQYSRIPLSGFEQSGKHSNGGCFACPIGPKKHRYLSLFRFKTHIPGTPYPVGVPLCQRVCNYTHMPHHACQSLYSRRTVFTTSPGICWE